MNKENVNCKEKFYYYLVLLFSQNFEKFISSFFFNDFKKLSRFIKNQHCRFYRFKKNDTVGTVYQNISKMYNIDTINLFEDNVKIENNTLLENCWLFFKNKNPYIDNCTNYSKLMPRSPMIGKKSVNSSENGHDGNLMLQYRTGSDVVVPEKWNLWDSILNQPDNSIFKNISITDIHCVVSLINKKANAALLKWLICFPQILISSYDYPTIVHMGARYNLLHIVAISDNFEAAEMILSMLSSPTIIARIERYYCTGNVFTYNREMFLMKRNRFINVYLTTPDKICGDTPLHLAAKNQNVACLSTFIKFADNESIIRTNKSNETFYDILKSQVSKIMKILCKNEQNQISNRLKLEKLVKFQTFYEKQYHVMLYRKYCPFSCESPIKAIIGPIVHNHFTNFSFLFTESHNYHVFQVDGSYVAKRFKVSFKNPIFTSVGGNLHCTRLWALKSQYLFNNDGNFMEDVEKNHNLTCQFKCCDALIHAVAGPMTQLDAEKFRKIWLDPANFLDIDKETCTDILKSDFSKGVERMGRLVANYMNVDYIEYFSFLDMYVDITKPEWYRVLEIYLVNKICQYAQTVLNTVPLNTTLDNEKKSEIHRFINESMEKNDFLSIWNNLAIINKEYTVNMLIDDFETLSIENSLENNESNPKYNDDQELPNLYIQLFKISCHDSDLFILLQNVALNETKYPLLFYWKSCIASISLHEDST
ncbi:hypothetical protein A3Q56_05464 [Intoshia linei]|uniref:ANKLE2 third alpha/beta domain-containing protein n=1 Tax=Intoshia linei TaxID=1819745 RepID=A0A177AZM6_9BILA|nr:hypothetical protein A3Q56_05464 [Intoshia linei]